MISGLFQNIISASLIDYSLSGPFLLGVNDHWLHAEILLTMKNGCGIASAAVVLENRTLAP